ncbi:MAG: RtcB family protein [Sumerlaeia bacterium]
MNTKLNGKVLLDAGWKTGPAIGEAMALANTWITSTAITAEEALEKLEAIRMNPKQHLADTELNSLATKLMNHVPRPSIMDEPVPYEVWGAEGIQKEALAQLHTSCRLPVAVRGAQMPDGHVGYGLPIGGVLATRNAVIPYAVGVDISCRMHLTITNLPGDRLSGMNQKLINALKEETAFGMGCRFTGAERRDHAVMEDADWANLPRCATKDKAWSQLGSSGSGNHFVEWGVVEVPEGDASHELGVPAGDYVSLMSHSGSRGTGASIADYFCNLAANLSPDLPREAKHLGWLDLDSAAGQEYWLAMNLAGRYAVANHECIHQHVLKNAGLKSLSVVQNHHNFAWKETYNGEELIVHRKGATPAGLGVLGVIPGSMADPAFMVKGKGNERSLNSASHGAGRNYGRKQALKTFTKSQMKTLLQERGVELLGGGVDESPMVYKPIREVMAAQADLVDVLATFHPKIVLMSND